MSVSAIYARLAWLDLENPEPSTGPLSPQNKRQILSGNISACAASGCTAFAIVLPEGNGALLLLLIAVGLAFSRAIEGLWSGSLRTLASSTKLHVLVGLALWGRGEPMLGLLPLLVFVLDWVEAASALVAPASPGLLPRPRLMPRLPPVPVPKDPVRVGGGA